MKNVELISKMSISWINVWIWFISLFFNPFLFLCLNSNHKINLYEKQSLIKEIIFFCRLIDAIYVCSFQYFGQMNSISKVRPIIIKRYQDIMFQLDFISSSLVSYFVSELFELLLIFMIDYFGDWALTKSYLTLQTCHVFPQDLWIYWSFLLIASKNYFNFPFSEIFYS